jgi:histidinol-phosphate aminotransferase|tara:strand:- start:4786 stop:5910 length:1125 start_codon:yes stop_codon:yes gene_type:complete
MTLEVIDPKLLFRDEIANLPVYKTGTKFQELTEEQSKQDMLRLGSNENPYGPSPQVLKVIQESLNEVHLYPDSTCTDIANQLGDMLGIDSGRLIFNSGSEAILHAMTNACLRPGDNVVSLVPSFPIINIFSAAAGANVIGVPHEDDLTFRADKFCQAVSGNVRMVYLVMPNNPTGSYFAEPEFKKIVAAANPETLFVLDEAYVEFAGDKPDYPDAIKILEAAGQPYISLRTMSKAYALAGMRIGYGIAYCEEFATLLKRTSTVFNIGGMTLNAAEAALADQAHLAQCLIAISTEKSRIEQEFVSHGIRFFNSAGNFICLSLPTVEQALAIEAGMQKNGIFTKGQKGRGNEGVLRITIGKPADNDRMLAVLSALI